mgnify:CR=1 FL=1
MITTLEEEFEDWKQAQQRLVDQEYQVIQQLNDINRKRG